MNLFSLAKDQRLLGQAIQCRDGDQAHDAVRQLASAFGAEHTVTLGKRNGVACIMGHGFDVGRGNNMGNPALVELPRAHQVMSIEISALMKELDRVADLLASDGIPVVALKNAGIARGILRCPGCNPMGDLDVLVRRSDFRTAHQQLLANGYSFRYRSSLEPSLDDHPDQRLTSTAQSDLLEYAERTGGAEYRHQDESGRTIWLELQWRPVAGRWIRPDQEPGADEFIERSAPIEGSSVRLLSPEDNLLQVALHTAKHSYVRSPGYRLHTDVDRVASLLPVDWDSLVRATRHWHVRTPIYFSLQLARELLSTPIPDEVLADLRPKRLQERWIANSLQKVGLFDPDTPKFSRSHYLAFAAMLYDDLWGLARAMFPPASWMRERYRCSTPQLPWVYIQRNIDLLIRRHRT